MDDLHRLIERDALRGPRADMIIADEPEFRKIVDWEEPGG